MVYRELEHMVTSASPQEDLKWFFNTHGPGMNMNWPHFEVDKYQTKRFSEAPYCPVKLVLYEELLKP